MSTLKDIINFYKECYIHDYRGFSIRNMLSGRVEQKFFPDTLEILNDSTPIYPVDNDWGTETEKVLLLEGKDKELVAGSFFINGEMKLINKKSIVFAPLYLHKVKLHTDQASYFISLDNPMINPGFLDYIRTIDTSIKITYDELAERIPESPSGFRNMVLLQKELNNIFPKLDTSRLDEILKDRSIKPSLHPTTTDKPQLLSGIMIGMIDKPNETRDIINELTEITNRPLAKNLLNKIFFDLERLSNHRDRDILVPASLSEAQKNVFFALDNYDVSVVIGPPGTGKSFTIAALATDLIRQGKSVLISSKNAQAGSIIIDKLEKDFSLKNLAMNALSNRSRKSFTTKLKNLFNKRTNKLKGPDLAHTKREINSLLLETEVLTKRLLETEVKEIKWGKFYYKDKKNFLSNFEAKWVEYQKQRVEPVWKIKKKLDNREKEKNEKLIAYFKNCLLYTSPSPRDS